MARQGSGSSGSERRARTEGARRGRGPRPEEPQALVSNVGKCVDDRVGPGTTNDGAQCGRTLGVGLAFGGSESGTQLPTMPSCSAGA